MFQKNASITRSKAAAIQSHSVLIDHVHGFQYHSQEVNHDDDVVILHLTDRHNCSSLHLRPHLSHTFSQEEAADVADIDAVLCAFHTALTPFACIGHQAHTLSLRTNALFAAAASAHLSHHAQDFSAARRRALVGHIYHVSTMS